MKGKIVVSLAIACLLFASDAFAGRIFGDVKTDGKPVPAGVMITVAIVPPAAQGAKPAPVAVDTAYTDKFGSYKLNVKQEGKCLLTIAYEKQSASLEVFSYKAATRYDLALETKDGKLSVRRK